MKTMQGNKLSSEFLVFDCQRNKHLFIIKDLIYCPDLLL